MVDKLTLQDIDWDKIPADVEEIGIFNKIGITWYKDISISTYYYYDTHSDEWQWVHGTPNADKRIKRPTNIFTKSMLVAGKHIVETVGGEIYVVFNGDDGDFLFKPTNEYGWSSLYEYNEDLRCDHFDNMYDIVKVYTTKGSNFCDKKRLTLIWERTPAKVPTQKELQLAALQDTINKAQEQIEELMKD